MIFFLTIIYFIIYFKQYYCAFNVCIVWKMRFENQQKKDEKQIRRKSNQRRTNFSLTSIVLWYSYYKFVCTSKVFRPKVIAPPNCISSMSNCDCSLYSIIEVYIAYICVYFWNIFFSYNHNEYEILTDWGKRQRIFTVVYP